MDNFGQMGEARIAGVALTAAEEHLGVLLRGHTLLPVAMERKGDRLLRTFPDV